MCTHLSKYVCAYMGLKRVLVEASTVLCVSIG